MTDTADPRETSHHPRLRSTLYGHEDVENRLTTAFRAGRLHHAWLLAGPKGIGKATLAYRMARYLLRHPDAASAPESMAVDPQDGVFKRVAARGHSDLLVIERSFDEKTKRLKAEIGVAEARAVSRFFTRTAGEGGWRICIVDAADELNAVAANAILKILEEPPEKALILLVTQQSPGRLLPTIRSRCIKQNMSPLSDGLVAQVLSEIGEDSGHELQTLAHLAGGSPGRAVELAETGGAKHLVTFEQLVSPRPPYDRKQMMRLADQLSSRNEQLGYATFCNLLREWLMRRAINNVGQETAGNPARWAELYQDIDRSIEQANVLNLDRRSVMLEAFRQIEQTERTQLPL